MEVVKFSETWAISREQEQHREALMTFGERVILRRVWKLDDLLAGRTIRCPDCHAGTVQADRDRIAAVYQQAGESYCTTCFGTGFQGGFEPVIYLTYIMVRDEGREWKESKTGTMETSSMEVQFPWTPMLDPGDLVVRVLEWNGDTPVQEQDRYVLGPVRHTTVRTGPVRKATATMVLDDPFVLVGQTAEIRGLSQSHPYRGVPVS